ncbi:cytochrome P450 [Streptomyces solisilvae]|uniref:cytochrome P450 n=1 Tax=Streptomyces malaysiensis TaxID=92644 RepID=UPI00367A4A3A
MNEPVYQPVYPQLFGKAFERCPEITYDALRLAGPIAWAELTPGAFGMVVTSHAAALDLLNNSHDFTRDTRCWGDLNAGLVPPDSPLLGIMGWRPSLLYMDDSDHARLSQALRDCLGRVEDWELEEITGRAAHTVINRFAGDGNTDLVTGYANTVPLLVLAELLGCPPDTSHQMVDACAKIIDAGPEAAEGSAEFGAYLAAVVDLKRTRPGRDLATWLLTHASGLTPDEVVNTLYTTTGAGQVPTSTWITQSTRLLLKDDPYAGDLTGGSVTIRRAMQKTLWEFSPLATFTFHIACHSTALHGVKIPAGCPVLISHAACNTDPRLPQGIGYDSRAHLAFSAGAHRCPATKQAAIITEIAISTLFDRLSDMEMTDGSTVVNRPGLFHQCPVSLNVAFKPRPVTATSGDQS